MTITETRNEKLAQRMIKNLERRHYDAFYCAKAGDVTTKVMELVPEGSTITWGGSMSIRDIGLTKALKEGNYSVYDRDDVTSQEDKTAYYRKAFECDYYLASANAISEDGVIVNIDGNGNRVAAIAWGPKHVILVVGLNKVSQDTDAAIKRARNTAAPINTQRFSITTPCLVDGTCHNCKQSDSICNYISIQRMSHPAHRHTVILVGEDLGY